MYKYRIYGLNVYSNLYLDCFPHSFDTADVVLEFTNSEKEARHFVNRLEDDDELKEISSDDGFGKFYFRGDKNIVVYYRNEDYLERYLVHVLFGFGFSYLLRRRKIFFLHGSGVFFDTGATIVAGSSEAGKSSLVAYLVQQGARIISDDTTRLELGSDTPYIYPSYPLRRLYKNTIEHLGLSMEGASELISKTDKYVLKDCGQNVFLNQDSPVKAIVRLAPTDLNRVHLVREDTKEAILLVCRNIFNYQLINRSEFAGDYLAFALDVCDRIPVYSLYRPRSGMTVEEQAEVLLEQIYNRDTL